MRLRNGILFLFLLAPALLNAAPAKRAVFEPPDGKILLIAGQNREDIRDYVAATHRVPGGLMAYTSLRNLEGLSEPFNQGDGTQDAQSLVRDYPDTVLQIGLWMVDDCARTAQGELDGSIDRLADWIQRSGRPVFLRIGYEFDNPENHYAPQAYIAAFRHIVERFRKRGVGNVAFVWHSYASKAAHPLSDWYPGDDVVDWVGISYFNQMKAQMLPVVELAKAHAKPVMIAESSPWRVQTRYPNAWNLWFVPYFNFIQDNGIKAFCYISCNWDTMRQFQNQHWGDTRIGTNPEILSHWQHETAQDRYLQSSPNLYLRLGTVNESSGAQ